MRPFISRVVVVLLAVLPVFGVAPSASAAPEGTVTWGVHITLASRWVDPAETEGIDRKSTRLNSSHIQKSRMPSSA